MKAVRFMHAADLHLDSPFKGLSGLPDELRTLVRDSTLAAFDALIGLAVGERVDFVLLAGDIYDAADRSLRAQLRFRQGLERLAERGIPAFVIHGNHDPAEEGWRADLRLPELAHVFSSREVETVPVVQPDGETIAWVHGISYARPAVTDNLALRYARTDSPLFQAGLLHGNVDGRPGHDNYAPCRLADLTAARLDYWALGHIHSRAVLSERPAAAYPGNPQGRSIRETGPRGCYIVEAEADGHVEWSFRETDAVRWARLDIDIGGIGGEQELHRLARERIDAARRESGGRPVLARLSLRGRGEAHRTLRQDSRVEEWLSALREEEKEAIRRSGGANAVWIESCRVQTGLPLDLSRLAAENGFLGDLLRLARELEADAEGLSAFAREAIGALADHPQAGRAAEELAGEEAAEWLRAAVELAIDRIAEEEERL